MENQELAILRRQIKRRRAGLSKFEREQQSREICRAILTLACSDRVSRAPVRPTLTSRPAPRKPARFRKGLNLPVFLPMAEEPDLWPAWVILNILGFHLYAPRVLPGRQLGWAPVPAMPFSRFFEKRRSIGKSAKKLLDLQCLFDGKEAKRLFCEQLSRQGWACSPYGILEPPAAAIRPLQDPDLIFVPCLAIDQAGGRIGYGGGYYDRFIGGLRATGGLSSAPEIVAICYRDQLFSRLPQRAWDQRVDKVISGGKIISFDRVGEGFI